MTTDDNQNADAAQAAGSPAARAASDGSPQLGVSDTAQVVGDELKPESPVENLKSNVPLPGDSLFTKVMKVITSWT